MAVAPAFDLVVLAELNPDVIVSYGHDRIRFGQVEEIVDAAVLTLGSSGAITASAAVAQGLRVALCAVVGDDALASTTLDLLARRGIDASYVVRRPGRATGMTIVLRRPDGDRAMLTFPGTMADLCAADVPEAVLLSARHVHVSSLHLQRALQADLPALLATARRGGAGTSLDPGWDPAQEWVAALPVLEHVDHLLPNGAEALALARALTGHPPADLASAATELARVVPCVAVKTGADGALVVAPGSSAVVGARPVDPVDTTGAGDNFDAGYLAAILDGATPVEATARGVASGSISVTGHGGTGRHASRAEAVTLAATLTSHAFDGPHAPGVAAASGPAPKEFP